MNSKVLYVVFCAAFLLAAGCSEDASSTGRTKNILSGLAASQGLTPAQKQAVAMEMGDFYNNIDRGCPCLLPQNETKPEYKPSLKESEAMSDVKTRLREVKSSSGPEYKDYLKKLGDSYFNAYQTVGIPAERYLMQGLAEKKEKLKEYPTDLLEFMRLGLAANIERVNTIATEDRKGLDPQFVKFTEAELKTMIQVRRSIIDELAKR